MKKLSNILLVAFIATLFMNSCSWFNGGPDEPTIGEIHIPYYIYTYSYVMKEATDIPVCDECVLASYTWLTGDSVLSTAPMGYWYSNDSSYTLNQGKRFRVSKLFYEYIPVPEPVVISDPICPYDSCIVIFDTFYVAVERNINYAVLEFMEDGVITGTDTAFFYNPMGHYLHLGNIAEFNDSFGYVYVSDWADNSYRIPTTVYGKDPYLMELVDAYYWGAGYLPWIVFFSK